MASKETDEPTYTERMGKPCPSCGWCAEIISTYKDGTVTIACANCFMDKTPIKSPKTILDHCPYCGGKTEGIVGGKVVCSDCGRENPSLK